MLIIYTVEDENVTQMHTKIKELRVSQRNPKITSQNIVEVTIKFIIIFKNCKTKIKKSKFKKLYN